MPQPSLIDTTLTVAMAVLGPTTDGFARSYVPTVVYSAVDTSHTSLVPGTSGERFRGDFSDLRASASGNWWILRAGVDVASDTQDLILRRSSTHAASGEVVVREHSDASSLVPGLFFDHLDFGAVNDDGTVSFSGDFTGNTNFEDFVATWSGGGYSLIARQGIDASSHYGPGATWNRLSSAIIDNSGRVGFFAMGVSGTMGGSSDDNAYIFGDSILYQEGVTIPSGQSNGGTEAWQTLEPPSIDADGSSYITKAMLFGPLDTRDVIVVDNHVVIQDGMTLDGYTTPVSYLAEQTMTGSGDWFVTGGNDDGMDWILRNGDLIAANGEDIGTGTGEQWNDRVFFQTFFIATGNSVGEYVVGGRTNASDVQADHVLILNGTTEILREGDPVDLDGNGVADDGVFIGNFIDRTYDAVLTDDGKLFLIVELRDAAGNGMSRGLITVTIPAPPSLALAIFIGLGVRGRRRSS